MSALADHRILLVNDDGIDAPGMRVLEAVARQIAEEVFVVAPEENQSGASHSLSIGMPVRVRKVDRYHYAVTGSPAECVMLALQELLTDNRPTVCLAGINRGPNLADDTAYSGTIAAARESTQLGVPAVAMSQVFVPGEKNFGLGEDRRIHWQTSERWAPPVLKRLLANAWDDSVFMNLNFPGVPPDQVRGLRITRQGRRPPGCYVLEQDEDVTGEPYYRMLLAYEDGSPGPDSDIKAIADGYISLSPLGLDLTATESLQTLAEDMDDLNDLRDRAGSESGGSG